MNKGLILSYVHSRIVIFTIFFLLSTAKGYALEISFMVGDVKVIRDGRALVIDVGTEVVAGDIIKTGKGGLAVISYNDGSEIRVQENSRTKIGSKSVKDSDSVSVISGLVKAKFAKLQKGSERKIYSPTTVCSIRGTDLSIVVSESADTRVELDKGKLDVYNPYGNVKLEEKKNIEVGVGDRPRKESGKDKELLTWKEKRDEELDQDPETRGDRFKTYIERLDKRSSQSSKGIDAFNDESVLDKKAIEESGSRIDNLQKDISDDMLLIEATNLSLDGILNRFKKDKKYIYETFQRIKEESNRVLEQQRRNYEAIKAVREAYLKAYNEIMKSNKEYMDKIKSGIDMEKYKPKR